MQIVAADVGNSSVKLMQATLDPAQGVVVPGRNVCLTFEPQSLSDKLSLMDSETWYDFGAKQFRWFVSSVNSHHAGLLRELAGLGDSVADWIEVSHADVRLQIDLEQPAAAGIDRLLAAQAAKLLHAPDHDVIVVDCGTALTIDLVTRDNTFRGGVILAGPATNLRALGSMTTALPDLSAEPVVRPASVVARSTRDAMLGGAYLNGLGAIREVVSQFGATLESDPVVVGTGGGLGPWREDLPNAWIVVDNLVIDGLFQVALDRVVGNRQP